MDRREGCSGLGFSRLHQRSILFNLVAQFYFAECIESCLSHLDQFLQCSIRDRVSEFVPTEMVSLPIRLGRFSFTATRLKDNNLELFKVRKQVASAVDCFRLSRHEVQRNFTSTVGERLSHLRNPFCRFCRVRIRRPF